MIKYWHKLLLSLDPEIAHHLTLRLLQLSYRSGLSQVLFKKISAPCQVMGLQFDNPIGLAAGFDKNADYIDALAVLGFGFIEIGTVTPKPQIGNPKPRLFRLTEQRAIINRMGFNNKGAEYVAKQLEKIKYRGVLGINIGKNKETPNEKALDDYLLCFRRLWKYASYITINISSPNTAGLRELQEAKTLHKLLLGLKQEQKHIHTTHHKYIPLVVKIAPDLRETEITDMAKIFMEVGIDGIIATNTTTSRKGVEESVYQDETGGLSGAPLLEQSTNILATLNSALDSRIPIIASGGILDAAALRAKRAAGAQLAQVYTGFIYEGPGLISALQR